ncbi:hypothetical protein EHQ52_17115 [Leptospira koniambonensis]|uniref:Uncharacterized protein n=1 Tax=Leptospira koniambonensis TaxID=2484950 RepID=A0A4R9J653_9LEPT|nr:hypothetical protein [Leptospira koniambonensis]TGL31647.1 hypothetical protein EHQ52_17115 [Leptospira koniambonensis]
MNKAAIVSIFKNKFFQFSVVCYLLIQILLITRKYFDLDTEKNDTFSALNYLIFVLIVLFFFLGLKSIMELTAMVTLPDLSLLNMFGRLAIFTVPSWFIFLFYSHLLMILLGIELDSKHSYHSPLQGIIFVTGLMIYFIVYLAGGAIVVGSRTMVEHFKKLKKIFSNRESYIYFTVFFIPYILLMTYSVVTDPIIRKFDQLIFSIVVFVIYLNFILLVKHWQRIESTT